jgi:hypothetical protein
MPATIRRNFPAYCTIAQGAIWIETRDIAEVEKLQARVPSSESVEELHAGLRASRLAATGLVDGGERRVLTGLEWHDYSIEVVTDQKAMQSIFSMCVLKQASHTIVVRSLKMAPAEVVRNRIGRPMAIFPSRRLVFHRFVESVLITGNDLLRQFPGGDELIGMKTSEQIRFLMDRYGLGPEHGHHKSMVVEDMFKLFKSHQLPILNKDTLARAVRREYDRRRSPGKLAVSSSS